MLIHLAARNLGLINEAELVPANGFTVITGETGAGKTLLLGALRLLLGENADSSIVGPYGDSATAEGVFLDVEELPVSRIVPREGRSRAYRDGVIVSATTLRDELGSRVQIIGQHDQLDLKKSQYVVGLLDANLDEGGLQIVNEYQDAWARLAGLLDEQSKLGGSRIELARELDLARYQQAEISNAGFEEGEDVVLEQSAMRLRNLEEIQEHLGNSGRLLERLVDDTGELVSFLRKVAALDPSLQAMADTAEGLSISTADLARELAGRNADLDLDPESGADIERRLTLLGDLKMKYGKTLVDVIAYGDGAGQHASELAALLDRASSIDSEVEEASSHVADLATHLSISRKATAGRLASGIESHLSDVGLSSAILRFEFSRREPAASGADRVELMFSSHDRLQAGPISKVASGGELSRLILSINLATGTGARHTLVFDEVDAGVGGATALAVGRKLSDLAAGQQLLCVTHLPQVAAFADRHYVIRRNGAEAVLELVEDGARLEEISRMMAGLPESDRGQDAAAELLEMSRK
ncbi:MAG TPA: AAA family ATPase [Acidimicrobiia bacterium]